MIGSRANRTLGPNLGRIIASCGIACAVLALVTIVVTPASASGGLSGSGGIAAALLVLGAVIAMLLIGEPLFVIIGVLAGMCFFLWSGYQRLEDYQLFVVEMANLTTKNVLLAIPFFVISGALMTAGGMATRLIEVARTIVGKMPGGLAMATVGACVFFSAISGSSPVTVIAIGSIMYPALVKYGYPSRFSLGLLATAGSLGILIPPSIPMLIYAIVASGTTPVNVAELFLAGVVPGLFIATLLSFYGVKVIAGYKTMLLTMAKFIGVIAVIALAFMLFDRMPVVRTVVLALMAVGFLVGGGWFIYRFRESFWSLMLPVIILGGIYSGLFTPTEAAAVSVVYALVVELFIHREIGFKRLPQVLVESGVLMGALLVIMALAFGLNKFLVEAQVPVKAVGLITDMNLSPLAFLLIINVLLILVGFVMDSISAILILTPLLVPIAFQLGIDPVHLGVIFIVNLEIGYLTPPMGLNLFVTSAVFKRSMGEVIRAVVPFIGLMVIGLACVTYIPSIAMGPVNVLLRGEPFWTSLPSRVPVGEEPSDPAFPAPDGPPPAKAPGKVMTMDEMMKRSREKGATEKAEEPGRVMTMEEMMRRAREREAEGDPVPEAEVAPDPEPPRVMTMEEMMRRAREREAAEAAAAQAEEDAQAEEGEPDVEDPDQAEDEAEGEDDASRSGGPASADPASGADDAGEADDH